MMDLSKFVESIKDLPGATVKVSITETTSTPVARNATKNEAPAAHPRINQEVYPIDLDAYPSIVAVVDRDGDVWVRDGDVWSYASPADFSTEVLSSRELEREYGVLRVAWVWL